MMMECENCPIRQLCDEVDDCYDEGHVDYKLLEKIYMKGKEDGIKEANLNNNVKCGNRVRKLTAAAEARIRVNERKKVLDEVIEIARAEIDFENQAEQIRFVEFMEEMKKEKNNG